MSDEVTPELNEQPAPVEEQQANAGEVEVPVVVAVVEEPVAAVEEPVVEKKVKRGGTPSPVRHVVSGGDTDDVYLDKCVYKNTYSRKSLTIHHVQRRLVELGYRDAGSDKDGWYGDLTQSALAAFQRDRSLEGDGCMNADTFVALFDGDQNVTVHVA